LIFFETIVLGILMFSNVRYFSFKAGPKGDKVPAYWVLLAILVIVLLALDPPVMGMIFGSAYVITGLLITIAGRRNWKLRRVNRPGKQQKTDPVIGTGSRTVSDEYDDDVEYDRDSENRHD
jgi:CDP-diacylglycerol--serine O-phosphatidyltransferase